MADHISIVYICPLRVRYRVNKRQWNGKDPGMPYLHCNTGMWKTVGMPSIKYRSDLATCEQLPASNQDQCPNAGLDLKLAKRIARIRGHALLRLKNGSENRIIQGSKKEATRNPECPKPRTDEENSNSVSAEYEKTWIVFSKSL